MRIGQGYDVHRLRAGRKLILGGVEIPHKTGPDGHSDADVLLHAVMDTLLGAAALGDIGGMFPDSDPRYADADSGVLLRETMERLRAEGFELHNLDSTIIMQKPKLAPYIQAMRENIAAACGVPVSRISVKATTEEWLGFTGREEGVAAHCAVLLREPGEV